MATPPVNSISFDDLINNQPTVNSSGWFKELMDSMNAYVLKEFEQDRITGNDYSNVYLGSMKGALDSVLKYVLEQALINLKLDTEKKNQELIQAQIRKLDAETNKINVLLPHEEAAAVKNLQLVDQKIEESRQDILYKQAQVQIANAEILIKEKEALIAEKNLEIKVEELEFMKQKWPLEVEQIKQNIELARSNTLLTDQKLLTEIQNTEYVQNNALLVAAKTSTETVQQYVLNTQAALYVRQKEAFKAKHVLAVAELYMKPHIVNITQAGEDPFYYSSALQSSTIKDAVEAAKNFSFKV